VKKDGPNHGRYFTTCPHWSDKAKKCRLYRKLPSSRLFFFCSIPHLLLHAPLTVFQDLEDGAIPSIGNPTRPLPDGAMPPSPSQKRRELENDELIRAVEAAENRAMLATPQKNTAAKRYSPDWEDPSDHDDAKRAYLITPTSNKSKSNKRQKRVIESSDSENEIQILEIPLASTSQSRHHHHSVGVNVKRSSTPTPSFSLPLSPPPPPASMVMMNTPPLLAKKEKVEKKYDTSLEKRVKELEKKLSATEKKLSATEDEIVALREDKVHLMKVIANLKS
jgi:hypothetical protein